MQLGAMVVRRAEMEIMSQLSANSKAVDIIIMLCVQRKLIWAFLACSLRNLLLSRRLKRVVNSASRGALHA